MDDLALRALRQARGTRGTAARRPVTRRAVSSQDAVYSGPRADDRDPQPAAGVVAGLISEMGWQAPVAQARVFADWPNLVGADIAARCRPTALRDGELRVSAESSAWATQLRRLSGMLLARLVSELGPTVVTKIFITGPTGPSWSHGGWSVRGARGPRDTYG